LGLILGGSTPILAAAGDPGQLRLLACSPEMRLDELKTLISNLEKQVTKQKVAVARMEEAGSRILRRDPALHTQLKKARQVLAELEKQLAQAKAEEQRLRREWESMYGDSFFP
jgi:septal ring factor EnvC (AmiA/AmiB activator)